MATESDDFTGGRDAALWDEINEDAANVTITDANNQVEVTSTISGNKSAGLVRKVTRDITAPSSVEARYVKLDKNGLNVVALTKTTTTDPYNENDWYRFGSAGSTFYLQKSVSGSVTTISSGAGGGGGKTYKLDFPATGDEVRGLIDGVEKASETTYALSSRDVYIYIHGVINGLTGVTDEFDFDDYAATYTAAGGVTASIPLKNQYNYKSMPTLLTR